MAVVDLAKQVGTTKGDLYVYNGTTLVRLPVGTDGHVLKADSGESAGVGWAAEIGGGGGAAFSGASLTKSADQTGVTAASFTVVTFDGTEYDTDSYFNNANDELVAPSTGYYRVWGHVAIQKDSGSHQVGVGFHVAGVFANNDVPTQVDTSGAFVAVHGAIDVHLAASETVKMAGYIGGGTTRTFRARCRFGLTHLGS